MMYRVNCLRGHTFSQNNTSIRVSVKMCPSRPFTGDNQPLRRFISLLTKLEKLALDLKNS